jgi:hypothetical protein
MTAIAWWITGSTRRSRCGAVPRRSQAAPRRAYRAPRLGSAICLDHKYRSRRLSKGISPPVPNDSIASRTPAHSELPNLGLSCGTRGARDRTRRFIVQAETSALYCLLAHRTRKLSGHWSFPYSGDAGRSAKPGNLARGNRGVAQPGRALRLGRRCRRFKSCHPDQLFKGWEALRRSRAEKWPQLGCFGSTRSGVRVPLPRPFLKRAALSGRFLI